MRRVGRALGVIATAYAVSACGGSSAGDSGGVAAPPSPQSTVTTTATSSPASTQPSTGGTPTTNTGPSNCGGGTIRVTLGKGGAGLGHNDNVLLFRNVSNSACVLRGYPGVTPYLHSEQGTPAKRTMTGYSGGAKIHEVLLRPGRVASAMVEGTDVPTGHKRSCPTYTSIRVTPPNLHAGTTLNVHIPACSRLEVHPVTDGTDGTDNP